MSAEREHRSSGGELEAAYRLVHRPGVQRASAVVGRHAVDGAQVPAERSHAARRVERPRLGRAVARPRHHHVVGHVHVLATRTSHRRQSARTPVPVIAASRRNPQQEQQ